MDEIVLYPGNWLYNAGVVGFLRILEASGYRVENCLSQSGEVRLPDLKELVSPKEDVERLRISSLSCSFFQESFNNIFSEKKKIEVKANSIREVIQETWGTIFNVYYRGFFNADSRYLFSGSKKNPKPLLVRFDEFVRGAFEVPATFSSRCVFCDSEAVAFTYKNSFSMEHSYILGASLSEMPNAFWNNDLAMGLRICDRCSFMILCSHLAFIPVAGKSTIFINAPSFEVMWHLNNLAKELYSRMQSASIREILGISLIELALRLQKQLGMWTEMNIEVVSRQGNRIDFFSLPYEVTHLLLDSEVARFLTDLQEFSILRMVLDGRFQEILEVGERLFALAVKPEWEKIEQKGKQNYVENYVDKYVHLENNKRDRSSLQRFASSLFILYATIQEKLGGGGKWMTRNKW